MGGLQKEEITMSKKETTSVVAAKVENVLPNYFSNMSQILETPNKGRGVGSGEREEIRKLIIGLLLVHAETEAQTTKQPISIPLGKIVQSVRHYIVVEGLKSVGKTLADFSTDTKYYDAEVFLNSEKSGYKGVFAGVNPDENQWYHRIQSTAKKFMAATGRPGWSMEKNTSGKWICVYTPPVAPETEVEVAE